jgi:hypothetical protein
VAVVKEVLDIEEICTNDHSQKDDDFGGAKKILKPRLPWSLVVFLLVEI